MILAGGAGTRLAPITHTSAKQLVPVGNKPVLFFALEAMRDAGIREVGIIVGDTQDEIRAAVGDGSAFGLEVTYVPQDAPRGLAHAVLIAEDFLAGEPFVMYLGDNLLADGITGLVEEFRREAPDALILLQHVDDPRQFGIAELDGDGRVTRLVEKPSEPRSRPRTGRRVHVHRLDLGVGQGDRTLRRAESSRSPTRSSTSSTAG